MERASFNLKIKSVDEAGKFTGIGAVFGNVDLGGDRIMPGAFTRTLAAGKQFLCSGSMTRRSQSAPSKRRRLSKG